MSVYTLEILKAAAVKKRNQAPPLLMIHGAYAGSWCWEVSFLPYFTAAGFDVIAPSLRGHAGSMGREKLDHFGIDDYVKDILSIIADLPEPPILMGHSMGGLVAQRVAKETKLAGLVLLASVAPYGVAASFAHLLTASPSLLWNLSQFQWQGAAAAGNPSFVRELLFSSKTDRAMVDHFAARAQPESMRALTEMAIPHPFAGLNCPKLPCLVLGAGDDQLIPPSDIYACATAWNTQAEMIADCGHAMMADYQQNIVAERVLAWLTQNYPED
jgi:pimeloyl-ACP methyl ester carboxylesterase